VLPDTGLRRRHGPGRGAAALAAVWRAALPPGSRTSRPRRALYQLAAVWQLTSTDLATGEDRCATSLLLMARSSPTRPRSPRELRDRARELRDRHRPTSGNFVIVDSDVRCQTSRPVAIRSGPFRWLAIRVGLDPGLAKVSPWLAR
jgi:hypothetical protein